MGRARGGIHATTTTSFDAVMGARRGNTETARFSAANATPATEKELDRLLSRLDGSTDYELIRDTVMILQEHESFTDNPMVEQLRDAVAGALVNVSEESARRKIAGMRIASGLDREDEPSIIKITRQTRDHQQTLHLWAAGSNYASLEAAKFAFGEDYMRFACGAEISADFDGIGTARRGEWKSVGANQGYVEQCPRCAANSNKFSETLADAPDPQDVKCNLNSIALGNAQAALVEQLKDVPPLPANLDDDEEDRENRRKIHDFVRTLEETGREALMADVPRDLADEMTVSEEAFIRVLGVDSYRQFKKKCKKLIFRPVKFLTW